MGTIMAAQKSHQSVEVERNSTGMVRKIEETAELEGFKWLHSIASNKTGDILAIGGTDVVKIYCKQSTGRFTNLLSLDLAGSQFGVGHNCHVTITADGKYLVAKGKSIHVYSASGQYERVCYTARTHNGVRLTCITTTQDGRIIAGDCARHVITVHTPNGTVLKTIRTRIEPNRIAAINGTHAAICRWCAPNEVCVIDLESGIETRKIDINKPLHVCYDTETDCLLVSKHDGTIDQYSLSTGRKIACIAEGLRCPYPMIITGDGLLAVRDDNTIKFYNMSVLYADSADEPYSKCRIL